jgi:hypothetical protein
LFIGVACLFYRLVDINQGVYNLYDWWAYYSKRRLVAHARRRPGLASEDCTQHQISKAKAEEQGLKILSLLNGSTNKQQQNIEYLGITNLLAVVCYSYSHSFLKTNAILPEIYALPVYLASRREGST